MCSVTKPHLVGGVDGVKKKDWTARLISIAAVTTTNLALVTSMASFGSDWIRFTA